MKQQEEFFELNFVQLRRWFPFLHLLRVPGIALDWRKLILGALATLVVVNCLSYFDLSGNLSARRNNDSQMYLMKILSSDSLPRIFVRSSTLEILRPLGDINGAFVGTVFATHTDWNSLLVRIAGFIAIVLVWSFFAIAITRIAGEEFVSGTRGSLIGSLKNGLRGISSALFFLVVTCLILGFLWSLNACWGYLVVSYLGDYFGMTTGFIPTLIAIGMFVILFGMGLGWPLMISAISIDAADGFDALSRTYNYVTSRFLPFLFYFALLLLLGMVFLNLVLIAGAVISSLLIASTMSWNSDVVSMEASLSPWSDLISILASAYAVSFFWSGMAVIYFLLRKAEDGTPLDEIYSHQKKEEASGIPLVGIAERKQTEQ